MGGSKKKPKKAQEKPIKESAVPQQGKLFDFDYNPLVTRELPNTPQKKDK